MDTLTASNRRRVRVWLAENDLSQAWLAEQLGISEAGLSLALTGVRPMTDEIRDGIYTHTGIRLRKAA